MKSKVLAHLPAFETEPHSDWSILLRKVNGAACLTLAYAVQRDFLSVPRTFQLMHFFGSEDCPLEFHQLDRHDYLIEMQMAEAESAELGLPLEASVNGAELADQYGWFQLAADDEAEILLLLDEAFALEIAFAQVELEKVSYHCANSQAALAQLFAQSSS